MIMNNITRVKASIIHFCLSLAIFSIIFFMLFTLWYPEPYFTASGGWQGLKIAASVDLVLGPLLTLIVFDPKKTLRALSIDLAVVATIQAAALIWGILTIYNQRPVAVVFWDDSFMVVAGVDLKQYNYPIADLKRYSQLSPPLIYVEKPTKLDDLKKVLSKMREDEIAPHHQTELYRPFAEHFEDIEANQLEIKLLKLNQGLKEDLEQLLSKTSNTEKDVRVFPLKAKYQELLLVFNLKGEQIGYLTPQQKSLPAN